MLLLGHLLRAAAPCHFSAAAVDALVELSEAHALPSSLPSRHRRNAPPHFRAAARLCQACRDCPPLQRALIECVLLRFDIWRRLATDVRSAHLSLLTALAASDEVVPTKTHLRATDNTHTDAAPAQTARYSAQPDRQTHTQHRPQGSVSEVSGPHGPSARNSAPDAEVAPRWDTKPLRMTPHAAACSCSSAGSQAMALKPYPWPCRRPPSAADCLSGCSTRHAPPLPRAPRAPAPPSRQVARPRRSRRRWRRRLPWRRRCRPSTC